MTRRVTHQWMVRSEGGQTSGPFATTDVIQMIRDGKLGGGEFVASYPGGQWTSIGARAEFRDLLLNQGANIVQFVNSAETQTTYRVKKTRPSFVIPLLLFAGCAAIAFSFLESTQSTSAKNPRDRVRLLAPRSGQPPLSSERLQEKFHRGMMSFQQDTFAGYLKAQDELVTLVESIGKEAEQGSQNAQAASTLCLVYRELWPYAIQDAVDIQVVQQVARRARTYDPAGIHGGICEVVAQMLSGNRRNAQSLVDSLLVEEGQVPVLFEIRGELYMFDLNKPLALNYFERARALWPSWLKTSVQLARAHAQNNQLAQAVQLYRQVIQASPQHATAKIELAELEARRLNHDDIALNLLLEVKSNQSKLAKNTEFLEYALFAEIYLRKNETGAALEAAKKAYRLNPSSAAVKEILAQLGVSSGMKLTQAEGRELMYVGDQYLRQGDCFAAQAEFKAAFEAQPQNGVAAMKAGKCLWQLNQTQEAIDWLKKAIAAEPKLIQAYVDLADYYAQRFDYSQAVAVLQRAQSQSRNSYEVFKGMALVEFRRNNFAGAIAYITRALKLYDADTEIYVLAANSLLGQQNYLEAQRYTAKALELEPNNYQAQIASAKTEAALRGVDAGAQLIQKYIGKFVLSKGQAVPAAAVELRAALGDIYLLDGRNQQAHEVFRQALSLDPRHQASWIGLGKTYEAKGQLTGALESYLKASVLDPSDAEPIFRVGQVYVASKKYQDATAQFQRVLRINPRYPRANIELGRISMLIGNPQMGLAAANAEKAINPEMAEAYLLAAESNYVMKQYTACAGEYQKAAAKRAQNARILVAMARCYRLSGAIDSAQSLLNQVKLAESGYADLYREQGAVFHTKGMADEALAAYETYLNLAPNAPDAKIVRSYMQRIQSGDLQPLHEGGE